MSDPTATNATGTASTPSGEEKMRKAELVRDKTGVSFEEARAALELSGYDVLDAVVLLERQGKTAAKTASYATSDATSADEQDAARMAQAQSDYEQSTKANAFVDGFSRFMGWLKRVLRKSVDTSLVAERRGKQIFSMPILIVILLVVFAFWVTIPLLIISLFFEFRYHFDGVGTIEVNLNDLSDKASDGVDNLKRTVMGDEASNQNGTQH